MKYLQENRRYWDENARIYMDGHPEFSQEHLFPSWGIWYRRETDLKLLDDLQPGSKLLDIGCGIGNNLLGWAKCGMDCHGVDLSQKMIDLAYHHDNCHYICSAAEKMPFSNGFFDAAYSNHGAFDFSPPLPLLREINRILKKGAHLVICTYSTFAQLCYSRVDGRMRSQLLNKYQRIRMEKSSHSPLVVSLSHSAWIEAFEHTGFRVKKLVELTATEKDHDFFHESPSIRWASRWPAEDIWKIEKYREAWKK